MRLHWWILLSFPILAGIVLTTAYFTTQVQHDEANRDEGNRQAIREALIAYGSLSEQGFDQVEILSGTEVRFFAESAGQATPFEERLIAFCGLLREQAGKGLTGTPVKLSYHHRRFPDITGVYNCGDEQPQ